MRPSELKRSFKNLPFYVQIEIKRLGLEIFYECYNVFYLRDAYYVTMKEKGDTIPYVLTKGFVYKDSTKTQIENLKAQVKLSNFVSGQEQQ